MNGKVLDYPAKQILNQGRQEGRQEGKIDAIHVFVSNFRKNGCEDTEILKLISNGFGISEAEAKKFL